MISKINRQGMRMSHNYKIDRVNNSLFCQSYLWTRHLWRSKRC